MEEAGKQLALRTGRVVSNKAVDSGFLLDFVVARTTASYTVSGMKAPPPQPLHPTST